MPLRYALLEAFLLALDSLRANKLRAALTLVGIVIGVGCVIVMLSLVEGARHSVAHEFESIGANGIFVVFSPEQRKAGERRGVFEGLTTEDADAIRRNCPLVKYLSPQRRAQVQLRYQGTERTAQVMGVNEEMNEIVDVDIANGRSLTADDVKRWRQVCVLGAQIAEDMFGDEDPLGKELTANGVRLRVVGVLDRIGRSMGEDRDGFVYAPLSMVLKRLTGGNTIESITAKAVTADQTNPAADQIWAVLRARHDNVNDFIVDTPANILRAVNRVINVFSFVLGSIGTLAMLVAGVGIMNIMLVSVTERTREIGLRKAVGARRSDILLQFLTESVTLSGCGGLVGVGFGYALAWTVNAVMKDRLPTYVPLWTAVMAFLLSVMVGIASGMYPAYRAAQLDPIEALRHE